MGRGWCGDEREEHSFQVEEVMEKKSRSQGARCGRAMAGDRDSALWRCIPIGFQVWEQKVFCPRRRVSRFPIRPCVCAIVLTRPSSCQWALCSGQEGQPSLNVMVRSNPSQGRKTELIQLRPGVLGFERATVSIL